MSIKITCVIIICCISSMCHISNKISLESQEVKTENIGSSEEKIKNIIKKWRQLYFIEPMGLRPANSCAIDDTYGFLCKWKNIAVKVSPYEKSSFSEYHKEVNSQEAIPFLLEEIKDVKLNLNSSETEKYLAKIIMEVAKIEIENNQSPSQEVIDCFKELLLSDRFVSCPLIQSACVKALAIMKTPDLELFLKTLKNLDKRHVLLGLAMLDNKTAKKEYFDVIIKRYYSLIEEIKQAWKKKVKRKEKRNIQYRITIDIMNDMIDLGAIAYYTGDRRVLSIYVKVWQDYMQLEDADIMEELTSAILYYALPQLLDYDNAISFMKGRVLVSPNKEHIMGVYYRFMEWFSEHKNKLFWSKEKQKFVVLEGDDIIKWICEQEIKSPIGEEKDEIEKLYQNLASEKPEIREKATQRLIEKGKKVVPIIKEGLNSDDLEVRVRVKHILTEIATRGE